MTEAGAGRVAGQRDSARRRRTLSPLDRQWLAADDGIGAVDQLLHTAEIAGRNLPDLLRAAVSQRDFHDARSPRSVHPEAG